MTLAYQDHLVAAKAVLAPEWTGAISLLRGSILRDWLMVQFKNANTIVCIHTRKAPMRSPATNDSVVKAAISSHT
jgi:hypothetical protein